MTSKARTLTAAALIVMLGMAVSRVLGFVRWMAIGSVFGRNEAMDAFIAAFTLPDLLYILVSGGALGAAFIPVFTELREKDRQEDAWKLANGLLNLVNVVVLVAVVAGIALAPWLVSVIVPGFEVGSTQWTLTVTFSQLLFPMVLFTTMSGLMNGWLQALGAFKAPAVAWSIYNVVIITVALTFGATHGLKSLCYATVAGAAAMVLVQTPGLLSRGWHPAWQLDLKNDDLRRVVRLFLPVMVGSGLSQINLLLLPTIFGSYLGEGDIMALQYANRLIILPLGLFGNAISMATFPTLCQEVSREDHDGFAHTLLLGLRAALVLCVPSALLFMVAGQPIMEVLFLSGKLTQGDTAVMGTALRFFSIGLVGYVVGQLVTKGFHAHQDTRTPLWIGLGSTVLVTVPVTWWLSGSGMGVRGVALGLSIGALVTGALLLLRLMQHNNRVRPAVVGVCLVKVTVACVPLVAAVGAWRAFGADLLPGRMGLLAGLSAASALGGVGYVAALVALKEESAALALGRFPVIGPRVKRYFDAS